MDNLPPPKIEISPLVGCDQQDMTVTVSCRDCRQHIETTAVYSMTEMEDPDVLSIRYIMDLRPMTDHTAVCTHRHNGRDQ